MGKENQYNENGFIPLHGGYQKLLSYKKSEIIYDGTVHFCKRFYTKYDRTIDQMVQAARSCKQNIAEASMASGTSKETEIKLTNVARASLEELLIDYKDFLRTNNYKEWDKTHPYEKRVRELNRDPEGNYETFRKGIENENPEICANVMIGLIKVTSYLLNRQIKRLEEDFLKEGGLRERMTRARLTQRNKEQR
ncbi:MAG: four helix bundle protein [Ignavibacteria bacterium GWB2_35_12]|nr:MAG: four helix bundle protein [Ignavibacteria bacterium GWB2_35_12]OGU87170.1 MAG: four helix bundle protein [Ignavibacteria bacterium RIFOXYA2_FULL_35_10]OGV24596.1 MAG: four helix bundle protein [Ignavibacteria bacterium RIFOXYC2_FULL_35_21]